MIADIDINERKLVEDALLTSEEHVREALENSRIASYKRNLITGSYDYLSPAYTRKGGYTPDEMEALFPLETGLKRNMIHPEDVPDIERVKAAALVSGSVAPFRLEFRFRRKDGQYYWLMDQFTVMRNTLGQACALFGSVSDISRYKKRLDDLHMSEARYSPSGNASAHQVRQPNTSTPGVFVLAGKTIPTKYHKKTANRTRQSRESGPRPGRRQHKILMATSSTVKRKT